MFVKIKNIFYLLFFIFFSSFTVNFYFSEKNIIATNKNRSFYSDIIKNDITKVPLLKSDTEDIFDYKNDEVISKKNKKYNLFWNLVGSSD